MQTKNFTAIYSEFQTLVLNIVDNNGRRLSKINLGLKISLKKKDSNSKSFFEKKISEK